MRTEESRTWLWAVGTRTVRIAALAIALAIGATALAQEDERSPDAPDLPEEAPVAAWIQEGNALLEAGQAAEAARHFEAQARAQPDNAMAQHLLGLALWQAGERDKARTAFGKALKLEPNGPHAVDARMYLAQKDPVVTPLPEPRRYPKAGTVIQDCPKCPAMVVVPAGKFAMPYPPGDSGRYHHEGPVRAVTFERPFAVGRFEVTFDEWDACVAEQGCPRIDDKGRGRGKRPVVYVSWDNAVAYTKWLSKKTGKAYRLLTEAEWEYAYRSGTDERHRFLNIPPAKVCAVANVYDKRGRQVAELEYEPLPCDDKFGEAAPVGSFKPNAFGLHDMMGNVAEWIEDCLPTGLQWRGAPVDGSAHTRGDCTQRGFRGGSFLENEKYYLRNVDRFKYVGAKDSDLGFRVARTLP